ncbi:MAG: DUF3187 domain-containing protein [Sulfurimonas sp. RIFCSPLOWO2_12_FULL_36_74]|uniref:thrombospondin type 3 repeat-containing protein n=1 Tax=Sulfurimonas sp. RIFCSPLOWO2_12_36_12 TaxID=1802253 RepID=UPI0008CD6B5E|nr:DUF3187 domain-containing protein [Sulfurimonas sp. RIFCSPLOWO2_12_36_12]OHD87294.1 MAG: DUF3187 domain-containing protein [Sulfuricurvum sp. RIFCSPLOWO2_02_43_6]OHD98327.1 MAG: DUF3187 domain-containing protein [Sulfurimonas sp. RIFCSPLOWO2_02_FULL_36_28]OHE01785.1 MAG: DUF3187 domain-containing protein [Sulfurimonas sp. RIFCSPLOWO2_12_36_12]OHE07168.1 MAG: DUF3187 domain-containing protein [Sulfurimonas sp. RIFCSPLOWO2_12_FULL_36_74]
MLKKTLIFLMATSLSLSAYSDYDMDGVDDNSDQCPNTPFNELVDIKGCTTKTLESKHHFDIIYGLNFSEADYSATSKSDTITQSLQIDYYYQNFSLQASSSYYNSDSESGINDSFIGAYYKLSPENGLTLRFGAGAIIPTYDTELDNNNMDVVASANFSYMLNSINLFGGYSYTMINDDDILGIVSYQNTNSYSGGIGFYPLKNLYLSGSYGSSDSVYKGTEAIETASVYGFYSINANWFTSFSYAYGLSDSASDNSLTFRLGYYF